MTKKNNLPVTVRLDSVNLEKFKKLYPKLLARFIDNAIELALNDKEFFTKIFFKEF